MAFTVHGWHIPGSSNRSKLQKDITVSADCLGLQNCDKCLGECLDFYKDYSKLESNFDHGTNPWLEWAKEYKASEKELKRELIERRRMALRKFHAAQEAIEDIDAVIEFLKEQK